MIALLSNVQCDDINKINDRIKEVRSILNAAGAMTTPEDIFSRIVDIESNIYERMSVLEDECRILKEVSCELNDLSSELNMLCYE
ncbi:hypothetical protein ACG0Z5_14450 [Scandinavium sp. M-37]|uniref:hypothetical protein n=1 Tax=Scandinavium sp. M-37 TaxID=3373077 RepID=UPI0037456318